jgi:hypothetical protein
MKAVLIRTLTLHLVGADYVITKIEEIKESVYN